MHCECNTEVKLSGSVWSPYFFVAHSSSFPLPIVLFVCLFFFLHIIFIIVLLAWKTLSKKIDCLKSRGDQSG